MQMRRNHDRELTHLELLGIMFICLWVVVYFPIIFYSLGYFSYWLVWMWPWSSEYLSKAGMRTVNEAVDVPLMRFSDIIKSHT